MLQVNHMSAFLKNIFLIGGYLVYNVVFISAILQHESAVGILMSLPLEPPSRLSQSSLHRITNSPWLSILYMTVCMLGFRGGSAGEESACSAGDLGLLPGLGRAPGEGKGYPLRYSGLENPMDCIGLGVAKSWTRPRDFHFHSTVLILFSAFIPGSPSPTLSTNLLFTSESPLLSLSRFHVSVQFSRSVVLDSLQPHEPQHTRPPCPSPSPGDHSDSCPLSR